MSDEQLKPVAWMHPHKPDIITLSHVDGYLPLYLRAAPKVKELVWRNGVARTPFGNLCMTTSPSRFGGLDYSIDWIFKSTLVEQVVVEVLFEDEAKAAAHAWYNEKILGELVDP